MDRRKRMNRRKRKERRLRTSILHITISYFEKKFFIATTLIPVSVLCTHVVINLIIRYHIKGSVCEKRKGV